MGWFTVDTTYTTDADLLAAVRPAHREWLAALVAAGDVLAGGPWADGAGGFFVARAADRAALDALLAKDPYTTESVAAARVIREWNIVMGAGAGAP